ncbi:unnamed protein product, partial [Mesorhabditis belari]|uniref:Uncharacterized protein n=1 Tax=Mesorhabditis belari TaxID=2138241 RepID=A0AAF3F6W2_9BILA
MGTSLIVTGEEEKSKMSKFLLILLGCSIFVVLIMPTNEQKDAQKKASDQEKFRMKFAQTMMGSVAESEACDKLEGDAKKACLVKIIDKVKEKMGKLRAEEERVMDDGEKILPHLDEPRRLDLNILAIPGCQPGHVRGQAVVLESFDDFRKVNVHGKIVVMVHKWMGYSWTVQNRQGGVEAARWGAIGYLAKSITPESMGSPHTGWGKSGIPSASITLEDAEMLKRLSKRGKRIMIEMNIRSRVMPDPAGNSTSLPPKPAGAITRGLNVGREDLDYTAAVFCCFSTDVIGNRREWVR